MHRPLGWSSRKGSLWAWTTNTGLMLLLDLVRTTDSVCAPSLEPRGLAWLFGAWLFGYFPDLVGAKDIYTCNFTYTCYLANNDGVVSACPLITASPLTGSPALDLATWSVW